MARARAPACVKYESNAGDGARAQQCRIKLTNTLTPAGDFPRGRLMVLCDLAPTSSVAIQTNNLRRLLHTVEALSELGPALTAERDFSETWPRMLSVIMEAAGAREGVLFVRLTSLPC